MISIVVLTLNEAGNLPRCLDSVQFSDDVLVLDSGSTDATCEIAASRGARVLTRTFDTFGSQRNHAMEAGGLRHPWVLHLDADEVVTPELQRQLLAIAASEEVLPGWRIPSKLIFMDKWLRFSGMYPAYQVRFGRRDLLRFIDHGHGQRESLRSEQIGTIRAPLEHFNFSKGINEWFSRHLRYAKAEAEQVVRDGGTPLAVHELVSAVPTTRRRALKRIANRLPGRPTLRFAYSFFLRLGFLDGRRGWIYAHMLASYQRMIDLNVEEMRRAP